MPLKQIAHVQGKYIPDPVYLDSNVLVSYFVPERRKISVINIIADLLSQRAKITLSWVVYHELIWGLLEHTYVNERKKREPEWSISRMGIADFDQHKEWLLPVAMGRLKKIPETLRAWPNVALFPYEQFGWEMSLSKLLETLNAPSACSVRC